MYCSQCHQVIPDGSRFCNLCGAVLGAPSQAGTLTPQGVPLPAEVVHSVMHPSFIFVGVRYTVAAILSVVIVVLGAMIAGKAWEWLSNLIPWVVGFGVVVVFLNPIYNHILRQIETYTLTSEKVEIQTGLLVKRTQNIPLQKIQDVSTQITLLNRMLGIGDVVIDSASSSGKIILRHVTNPQAVANEILARVRK